jgi:hypothetical protein
MGVATAVLRAGVEQEMGQRVLIRGMGIYEDSARDCRARDMSPTDRICRRRTCAFSLSIVSSARLLLAHGTRGWCMSERSDMGEGVVHV